MRPVHVIVTADHREADAWAAAFGNGIELYRFSSNNEAFERLIGATSPIQLLVISPSQDTMFNMRTEELVRRLVASPVGAVPQLSGLGIVVVGQQVAEGPRVVCCSTIDAAARFVLYGEREPAGQQLPPTYSTSAPDPLSRPQPVNEPPPNEGDRWVERASDAADFASRLIDSLWGDDDTSDRDPDEQLKVHERRGGPAPAPVEEEAPKSLGRVRMPRTAARIGTGVVPRRATLFGERTEVGDAAASGSTQALLASRSGDLRVAQSGGSNGAGQAHGGAPHLDAGPRVAIEDEPLLQPAREIMLERRGFRNDGTRGLAPTARHVVASGRSAPLPGSVPVPAPDPGGAAVPTVPAVAGQVAQMLYGGAAEQDPLLGWSSKVQDQLAAARADVVPVAQQPTASTALPQPAQHLASLPQVPQMAVVQHHASQAMPQAVATAAQYPAGPVVPQAQPMVAAGGGAPSGGNFAAPSALLERGEREGVSFG